LGVKRGQSAHLNRAVAGDLEASVPDAACVDESWPQPAPRRFARLAQEPHLGCVRLDPRAGQGGGDRRLAHEPGQQSAHSRAGGRTAGPGRAQAGRRHEGGRLIRRRRTKPVPGEGQHAGGVHPASRGQGAG
jgi:hypothetical protein